MKKIFIKDWLYYHPYKRSDEVDRYYTDVANEIKNILYKSGIDVDERVMKEIALVMSAWFEDVISMTGIWATFTEMCEKRYGSRFPFYEIGEDYEPDEVNEEDVRFLLWHCLQRNMEGKSVINPENPGIAMVAKTITSFFEAEFKYAPENERMQEFFDAPELEETDFYRYRDMLTWFCYQCYIGYGNDFDFLKDQADILKEYRDDQIDKNLLMYDARISRALSGRKNLLSLTAPEWLAAVWRRSSSSEPAIWDDVEVTGRRYFLYKGQDEQCIYLQDAWGEKREYAVTRDSVNLKTDQMEEGKTVLYSQLVKFGRYWWQNGIVVSSEKSSETDEDIADDNGETGKTNAREDFEHFMQASGGKFFVYCRDQEEMADFMLNKMNYKLGNEVNLPEVGPSGALLMASPCTGIHVQVKLLEGVCFSENAAYDQEKAKTEAVLYMVNPTVIPYDLSCVMQDLGMLPDASLNSLEGKEHGRDFVKRNARFLTDYFYHKYRERDFNEEDYRPWLPDGKA